MIPPKIQTKIDSAYQLANQKSKGILEIIRQAVLRFTRVQGLEAAAAIAYYTIFSIFPLLLVLISAAGFLMKGQEAVGLVLDFISEVLPVPPTWLEDILRQIVNQRDITGLVGLVGLFLAASGVFTTLARNINRAWPQARSQNLVRAQLIAFSMIAVLVTLMVLWVIWSVLINLLIAQDFPTLERFVPFHQYVLNPLAKIFAPTAAFSLFLLIYRYLPNTKVCWSEAFWGSLTASAAWMALNFGFGWYISSGMVNYDLLYGSLGTSIAMLTWVFLSSIIILFGAHLSAAIARATRLAPRVNDGKLPETPYIG